MPESAQIGGPDDYSAIEQRGDVLCYSSETLVEEQAVSARTAMAYMGDVESTRREDRLTMLSLRDAER